MGPSGKLRDLILEKLKPISTGKVAAEARTVAGEAVYQAASAGWKAGVSPYGQRWIGAKGRSLTLIKTGELFRSLRLDVTPMGARLSVGGPVFGRHTLATILQYGGVISGGRPRHPMTYRVPGGGWRSSRTVRIRPAPFLPSKSTEIPPTWEAAVRRAFDALSERHLK